MDAPLRAAPGRAVAGGRVDAVEVLVDRIPYRPTFPHFSLPRPPTISALWEGCQVQMNRRHLRCRVFRRTSPDCGWLPSNQRLGEACGGATDGQTGRYGVFTVSKWESFLLRRLGVSTGRWGGNLGLKAREVGKRPKCRVSWGKEKIHRPQALCFSGSQNSASASTGTGRRWWRRRESSRPISRVLSWATIHLGFTAAARAPATNRPAPIRPNRPSPARAEAGHRQKAGCAKMRTAGTGGTCASAIRGSARRAGARQMVKLVAMGSSRCLNGNRSYFDGLG